MFKKILVPTEISKASQRALATALQIAKQFDSEIELFHVTHVPQDYIAIDSYYSIMTYPSKNQLEESGRLILAEALKEVEMGNVTLHKKVSVGHPAAEINEEANKGFDLIVMGSRGHGPIAGALMGSVAQYVLAHAKCPVLIVK
jgi:nucleotide-binding universal stress UspA family protein